MANQDLKTLRLLTAAARAHGEISEPDHEVGDLQEILTSCWKRLSHEERGGVIDDCQHILAWLNTEAGKRLR